MYKFEIKIYERYKICCEKFNIKISVLYKWIKLIKIYSLGDTKHDELYLWNDNIFANKSGRNNR